MHVYAVTDLPKEMYGNLKWVELWKTDFDTRDNYDSHVIVLYVIEVLLLYSLHPLLVLYVFLSFMAFSVQKKQNYKYSVIIRANHFNQLSFHCKYNICPKVWRDLLI